MQRDWRLDIESPSMLRWRRKQEAVQQQIHALLAPKQWDAAVTPLVEFIIGRAKGRTSSFALPAAEGYPEPIRTALAMVYEALSEPELTQWPTNDAGQVLSGLIGNRLGDRTSTYALLVKLDKFLESLPTLHWEWLRAVDIDAVRRFEDQLLAGVRNASLGEIIYTRGRFGDEQSLRLHLDEMAADLARTRDQWDVLERNSWLSEEIEFRPFGATTLVLASRLGPRAFAPYLLALPYLSIRQAALRWVASLDFLEALLDVVLTEQPDPIAQNDDEDDADPDVFASPKDVINGPQRQLALIVVMRIIELWHSIDQKLHWHTRAPSSQIKDNEQWVALKAERRNWCRKEFPHRARALAERLVSGGSAGRHVVLDALRNLFESRRTESACEESARRGTERGESVGQSVTGTLRDALIAAAVATSSVSNDEADWLDDLLRAPVTKGSLISAGEAYFMMIGVAEGRPGEGGAEEEVPQLGGNKIDGAGHKVLDAYVSWVKSKGFWFPHELDGDDLLLPWTVAGVLARGADDPASHFQQLWQSVLIPSQGWNFAPNTYFEDAPRMAHVLLVGVLAAEWLIRMNREENARTLYDIAWKTAHKWLRTAAWYFSTGRAEATLLLSHLWARLPLVHPDNAQTIALEALPQLDHLDWVIAGATNLQANLPRNKKGEPSQLKTNLQVVIRQRYDEFIKTVSHPGADAMGLVAMYEEQTRKLCHASS